MSAPYVSNRAGSVQWIMQRVSAILLVFLAAVHFILQHFTGDAVSTGLTVSFRMNNPWWQAYYAVFIVLALYHGINGVIGILSDFNPRPLLRGTLATILWTLALAFGALGIKNVVTPVPLAAVKESYAARGFPAGISKGNPPSPLPGGAKHYDFRAELRELHLLRFYLERHTNGADADAVVAAFGTSDDPADAGGVAACGNRFDRWATARIAAGPVALDRRDGHRLFSSTYEFAVWAAQVRRANAIERERTAGADKAQVGLRTTEILATLANIPAYSATQLH